MSDELLFNQKIYLEENTFNWNYIEIKYFCYKLITNNWSYFWKIIIYQINKIKYKKILSSLIYCNHWYIVCIVFYQSYFPIIVLWFKARDYIILSYLCSTRMGFLIVSALLIIYFPIYLNCIWNFLIFLVQEYNPFSIIYYNN